MSSTKGKTQKFYNKYRTQCIGAALVVIFCVFTVVFAAVGSWKQAVKTMRYEPYLQSNSGNVLKDEVKYQCKVMIRSNETVDVNDLLIDSVSSEADKNNYARVFDKLSSMHSQIQPNDGAISKEIIVIPANAYLTNYQGKDIYSWKIVKERNNGVIDTEYNMAIMMGNDLVKATLLDKKIGAEVRIYRLK